MKTGVFYDDALKTLRQSMRHNEELLSSPILPAILHKN